MRCSWFINIWLAFRNGAAGAEDLFNRVEAVPPGPSHLGTGDRDLGQMKDRDLGQMKDRDLGQMKGRDLGQMKDKDLGQMKDRGLGQMKDRDLGQMYVRFRIRARVYSCR